MGPSACADASALRCDEAPLMVKQGRMQMAPEPTQQVTDTQAQPAGQLLLDEQRASPAQD